MTTGEATLNLTQWINLLYNIQGEISTYDNRIFTITYPEFEILVDKYNYCVLAMGWYYDFKEAEDVCKFIKGWKLI